MALNIRHKGAKDWLKGVISWLRLVSLRELSVAYKSKGQVAEAVKLLEHMVAVEARRRCILRRWELRALEAS